MAKLLVKVPQTIAVEGVARQVPAGLVMDVSDDFLIEVRNAIAVGWLEVLVDQPAKASGVAVPVPEVPAPEVVAAPAAAPEVAPEVVPEPTQDVTTEPKRKKRG